MIDDYKIKKASRMYADEVFESRKYDENHLQPHHIAFIEGNAAGFEAGAKWAINEFLKGLWHPASEEPKKDMLVLTDTQSIMNKGNICWVAVKLTDNGLIRNLSNYVKATKITRWLYIDDLLKGGEQ